MKKILLTFSCVLSGVIVCCIIIDNIKQIPSEVITVETLYNYTTIEDIIQIPIYFNGNNHKFKNKDMLNTRIKPLNGQGIKVQIVNIYFSNITSFKNVYYYCYVYEVKCQDIEPILIEEAYLLLEGEETIEVRIGEFSYQKQLENTDLDLGINRLYGVVSEKQKNLKSIVLKIENYQNSSLIIKEVSFLSSSVKPSKNTFYEVGLEYEKPDINEQEPPLKEVCFTISGEKQFVIPISYQRNILTYRTPIVVTYEVNNEEKEYYIYDFLFFNQGFYLEDKIDMLNKVII